MKILIVRDCRAACYAAHLAHEYMHTILFEDVWPKKDESVPYMVQKIVEEMLAAKNCNARPGDNCSR